MPSGVFIKENIASSIFKRVTSCTQDQMLAFHSFSSSEMMIVGIMKILTLEFTVSFAPLRPAGFVNFCGAGRGGARLAFCGAGRGSLFFRGAGRGGAGRASLVSTDLTDVTLVSDDTFRKIY